MLRGKAPNGSGSGSGSGDGYGYGYGDGSGDGDGYGYGYGYGYGDYWCATLPYWTHGWTPEQRTRMDVVRASGARLAFWRSDADGKPSNGGRLSEPAAPGVVYRERGPLNLCEAGTLHATLIPPKWNGERVWIVALHGEVIGDDEKFGCLEREILGECLPALR